MSANLRASGLCEKHGFKEEGRFKAEILSPDGTDTDDVWFALPLV